MAVARGVLTGAALALLLVCLAAPADAQLVDSFTKDDCNDNNDPCGSYWCDEVLVDPGGPVRRARVTDRAQFVLEIRNGPLPRSGLYLFDLLPRGLQIDCDNPCVDLDCDGAPESPPVHVSFSAGGFSDAPVCDPVGDGLAITGISLDADEIMEVRFCAEVMGEGRICNQARLEETGSGDTQTSRDPVTSSSETCLEAGPGPPTVSALQRWTDLNGGLARQGDTVEYTIELCETSGDRDVTIGFHDFLGYSIRNATLDPSSPADCFVNPSDPAILDCFDLVLPAGCPAPTVIELRAEVGCDDLRDGDAICVRGEVAGTDPPSGKVLYTDDPSDTTSNEDPTCFRIALDDLGGSTKTASFVDLDGDTAVDCEDETITWTIRVPNDGSVEAREVVFQDPWPPEAQYVSGSLRVDGMAQPDPSPPNNSVDLGDIPAGQSRTVEFEVVPQDLGYPYTLCNRASLRSDDNRSCGTVVYTDDPVTPEVDDFTCTDIACGPIPSCGFQADLWFEDLSGLPLPCLDSPGQEFVLMSRFCADLPPCPVMLSVQFEETLDDCLQLAGPVLLDGREVSLPFWCGTAPRHLCFLVDPSQQPGECHEVEIPVLLLDDPGTCPVGDEVCSYPEVGGRSGTPWTPDPPSCIATCTPPEPTILRDDHLSNRVGFCDPERPRLDWAHDVGVTFPYCMPSDGALGGQDLVYYEIGGDCSQVLHVSRTHCDFDGIADVELDYR